MSEQHLMLICTVGGAHQPVVASIKHWQPQRVWFVVSSESASQVEERILPQLHEERTPLQPGQHESLLLDNEQDLTRCVEQLRDLGNKAAAWAGRGEGFEVIVDFTGGTKCMSAALALQGRRWPCRFSYVGGSERTRQNLGVVVCGREQVLHAHNPWDALGYEAVEEAVALFDRGALAAAAERVEAALHRVQAPARRRELAALKQLAEGFDAWDRFQHADALKVFDRLQAAENDLRAVLGEAQARCLLTYVQASRPMLQTLAQAGQHQPEHVHDLLANAHRCAAQGRRDDAVARLYRAIEAHAQIRLREYWHIPDTGAIPLDQLPDSLRHKWQPGAEDDRVKIGLQAAYTLLHELGDSAGQRFVDTGLADTRKSPLVSRNQSILAHGFQPVSQKVFDRLWKAALCLVNIDENQLCTFPKLRA